MKFLAKFKENTQKSKSIQSRILDNEAETQENNLIKSGISTY